MQPDEPVVVASRGTATTATLTQLTNSSRSSIECTVATTVTGRISPPCTYVSPVPMRRGSKRVRSIDSANLNLLVSGLSPKVAYARACA